MNAKLVLALIAVAVVAVSAKPATRLENAVQEAALAFRDAATSAIKNAEGSAVSEVEHLAGAATGMVSGATSPASTGGIMSMISGFFHSILSIFGLGGSSTPSVGAGAGGALSHVPVAGAAVGEAEKLLAGATGGKLRRKRDAITSAAGSAVSEAEHLAGAATGGASSGGGGGIMSIISGFFHSLLSMIGLGGSSTPSVGAGVGGAGGMLSHIPVAGAALGEAEKLASSATSGKLRRKRDTNTPAAGAPAAGVPAAGAAAAGAHPAGTPPTGPAGAAAVTAVHAANTTANCSDVAEGVVSKIIYFVPRLLGLAKPALPLCSNATATATPGAATGAAAASGAAGGAAAGAAHPAAAGAPAAAAGTAPAPASGRRKRSPTDLSSLENMAAGALGGGGNSGNNVAGMLGQASNLMGAVTGKKCVLTWFQYFFSFFGLLPNACTMANAVGNIMG